MKHHQIYQIVGGKKHLYDAHKMSYLCGINRYSWDTYEGRLLSELDLDESFCKNCVRSFWKRKDGLTNGD